MKDVFFMRVLLNPQNRMYLIVPLLFATLHIYFESIPDHDLTVYNKLRLSHILESVLVLLFISYFLFDINRQEYKNLVSVATYKNPLKG